MGGITNTVHLCLQSRFMHSMGLHAHTGLEPGPASRQDVSDARVEERSVKYGADLARVIRHGDQGKCKLGQRPVQGKGNCVISLP